MRSTVEYTAVDPRTWPPPELYRLLRVPSRIAQQMHAQPIGIVLGHAVDTPVSAKLAQHAATDPGRVETSVVAQDVVRKFMRNHDRQLRVGEAIEERAGNLHQAPIGDGVHRRSDPQFE